MRCRLFLVFCVLLRFASPLQGDQEKVTSYAGVAVFPLPDRPPNSIEKLIGVLLETVPTGSRFEET